MNKSLIVRSLKSIFQTKKQSEPDERPASFFPFIYLHVDFTKRYHVKQKGNGNTLDSENSCNQVYSGTNTNPKECGNYQKCPFKHAKINAV